MTDNFEMLCKDGSRARMEGSIHLIKDALGQPVGFRGILRDVTARRRMEQALRESEARFRALTELSSDWYWEQDVEFRFTRVESRRGDDDESKRFLLGKRGWETGLNIEFEGGWEGHRALVEAHKPYRDVVMHATLPNGSRRYISAPAIAARRGKSPIRSSPRSAFNTSPPTMASPACRTG